MSHLSGAPSAQDHRARRDDGRPPGAAVLRGAPDPSPLRTLPWGGLSIPTYTPGGLPRPTLGRGPNQRVNPGLNKLFRIYPCLVSFHPVPRY